MTYEKFMSVVSERHQGAAAFSGMRRRGWEYVSRGGGFSWEKVGAGLRTVALEGDETWVRDTTAEWKAQHA